MGMTTWDFLQTQYTSLPLVSPSSIHGGVYIVTGGNNGLGLECVKHLVKLTASRVILTARSAIKGAEALAAVEAETGIKGVAEVWDLDLGDFDSVKAFAKKVNELERIDAVIENASLALDTWTLTKGMETSIAVNIIGTFLLGLLVLPKLEESGRKFGITPHLTVVGSSVSFDGAGVLEGIKGDILEGMNTEGVSPMAANPGRYSMTKLLQLYFVRQLASLAPYDKTGVVININCPGLCNTGLARHSASLLYRFQIRAMNAFIGRTPEQGARTLVYAATAGPESHGKFCTTCSVRDDWVSDWITNESGQNIQKRVWDEVSKKLEEIEPGCVSRIISTAQ